MFKLLPTDYFSWLLAKFINVVSLGRTGKKERPLNDQRGGIKELFLMGLRNCKFRLNHRAVVRSEASRGSWAACCIADNFPVVERKIVFYGYEQMKTVITKR